MGDGTEQGDMVLRRQVLREQAQSGEVQSAALEELEDHRELASSPGGGDPLASRRLGVVQRLGAVDEHRAVRRVEVQAPRVDLAQVGDYKGDGGPFPGDSAVQG